MNEAQIMEVKRKLKAAAAEKFPGDKERQNAYIYGTINKIKEHRTGSR